MPQKSAFVRVSCSMMLVAGAQCATAERNNCESLARMVLDRATIVSAVSVDAAPLKLPSAFDAKLPNVTVPRHCEASGIARPTSDSEIHFLLWLPAPEAWNGKYMQRGNGGWAGSIQPAILVTPLARGYAVSATDDGHQTTGEMPDASWAIGHPEKLIDFGYRSLHETASHSKAILQAYYGKTATHAYFMGCSDGGREALMEAERYPEDFDGIVAGAPANNWTNHFSGFAWDEVALHEKPESNIPVDKL